MNETLPQSVFRNRPAHFDVDGPLYGVGPETAIRTLGDVTRYHAERRPKCVAAWFEGRRTSYAELDSRVNRIAQALLAKGLCKDDHVIYAGKNSDRYFELLFGCAKAGVIMVPLSWRFAAHELADIVRNCGAKLIFADESTAQAVAAIASERLTQK